MPLAPEKMCFICQSPFRKEINSFLKKRVAINDIIEQYFDKFLYTSTTKFRRALITHKVHPLPLSDFLNKDKPSHFSPPTSLNGKPTDFKDYADEMLKRAFSPEMLGKLSPNAIIQAQRLLLERDKLKNQNDAMRNMWLKLMAGIITMVEGETNYQESKKILKEEKNEI